jgi:hypothetical protein
MALLFTRSFALIAAYLSLARGDTIDCTYQNIYPRQYVAYKVTGGELTPESLDGDLNKQVMGMIVTF